MIFILPSLISIVRNPLTGAFHSSGEMHKISRVHYKYELICKGEGSRQRGGSNTDEWGYAMFFFSAAFSRGRQFWWKKEHDLSVFLFFFFSDRFEYMEYSHRIIDYPELEGTHKEYQVQLLKCTFLNHYISKWVDFLVVTKGFCVVLRFTRLFED